MAVLNKVRIEDDAGNVYYPHTKASVVFMEDGKNAETVISQLSNPNLLINGDFQIWQRGTSINTSPYITYTSDRWYIWSELGNSVKVEKTAKGIKITRLTGKGSIILFQILDSDLTTKLKGKDVTVSINLKKGKGILSVNGANNAGSIPIAYTQKDCLKEGIYSSNISIPQDSYAHIAVGFNFSSIAVGATVETEWIKLELGEIATPLSPRPYGEELALCQMYYEEINVRPVSYSPQVNTIFEFPISIIEKRILPTITLTTGGEVNINTRYVQARTNKIIEVGLNSAGVGQTFGTFLIKMDSEIY